MVEQNGDYLKQLGINMSSLENEMNSAIAKESRYWLENDAKIKAVQQGVPTYDDFRELVAGCHLKPLDRSELINTVGQKSSWNYSTLLSSSNGLPLEPRINSSIHTKAVTTPQEFIIQWRKIKSSSTLSYIDKNNTLIDLLFNQNNELLENLFSTGLGVSFLPDILSVLNHALVNTETMLPAVGCDLKSVVSNVFMTIVSFQKSKQFSVAVDCLLDSEKEIAHQLIQRIKDIGDKFGLFEDSDPVLRKIVDTFK
ncbi:Coiled-coil domain-containing protein [Schistosoma japonicum]|uniref:Coiled-coil domain-containing protein n=1 Tax=Schistosoma japonicum TaxID=6182 RepID=A0A4Z2DRG0_SCHJA|nr:Coiled-coil domain-containing protein [Schistosoma japonicum]